MTSYFTDWGDDLRWSERILSPFRRLRRGRAALAEVPRQPLDPAVFGLMHRRRLLALLASDPHAWDTAAIRSVQLPAQTGAILPGEARALYHLVRAWRCQRVLEIGTHLGGSTIALAAGLDGGHLTTVDLADVNNPRTKPWAQAGAECSPTISSPVTT